MKKFIFVLIMLAYSVVGQSGDIGSSIFAALMAGLAQNGNVSVSVGSDDCDSYSHHSNYSHHEHHEHHNYYNDNCDHHTFHSNLSDEAAQYNLSGTIIPIYYKNRKVGNAWVDGPRAAMQDLAGVVFVPGRTRNIHFLIPVNHGGKRIETIQVLGVEEQ